MPGWIRRKYIRICINTKKHDTVMQNLSFYLDLKQAVRCRSRCLEPRHATEPTLCVVGMGRGWNVRWVPTYLSYPIFHFQFWGPANSGWNLLRGLARIIAIQRVRRFWYNTLYRGMGKATCDNRSPTVVSLGSFFNYLRGSLSRIGGGWRGALSQYASLELFGASPQHITLKTMKRAIIWVLYLFLY